MDVAPQSAAGTHTMSDDSAEANSAGLSQTTVAETPEGAPLEATNSDNEPAATGQSPEWEAPTAERSGGAPHVQEISQQNIKNRLNEVITEIEREVEQELDREDREDREEKQERQDDTAHAGQVTVGSERKLSRENLYYQRRSRFSKIHIEDSFDETDTPPIAIPPTAPEFIHESAPATEGQGHPGGQWQSGAELSSDADQSQPSGIVPDQNSDQSKPALLCNDQSNADTRQVSNVEAPAAPNDATTEPTVSMVTAQAQTEPVAYQAKVGRFTSPYSSAATSSLPRGWTPGGVAFAVSGHRDPQSGAHEAPDQQLGARAAPAPAWGASEAQENQWRAREAAASQYATLPRTSNTVARGWDSVPRADPPKRVHFADTPQVQMFEEEPAPEAKVTMRPRPDASRGPRPLSAPAAAQLFTIPNMAARPYGRTSPLVVTPVEQTSPPPMAGGGQVEVDTGAGAEQRENQEMSSLEPEPVQAIPPAPPVQKAPVPPSKIFTPAHDEPTLPQKKKTMFVDSAFFSPKVHPTWEQQVEMAKRISSSLSDASNKQSRGQSMYERRKKRSVKWVHGGSQLEAEDGGESPHAPKDKPLLQLLMNPHGHVYDLNALKKQGWIIDSKGGLSPEICSDLIKDLNSPNGKGAQIFAKRKKRAEKWVVDEEHREARKGEESQPDAAQLPKNRAPQMPPAAPQPPLSAPKPPQPTPAAQPAPVQLKPVPLQSLYQPSQTPQFPSGGVYAPRTAHSWSAAQEQTEIKKFKSTSSKAFSDITQGHSLKNTTQSTLTDSSQCHQAKVTSSQSTVTEASLVQTTQQSRLTRAMHSEEDKENISALMQNIDTADLSKQDVELKMAEAVFEETARQMALSHCDGGRPSLDLIDVPFDPSDFADEPLPSDPMEIDPDLSPPLAALKPIDKPVDWSGSHEPFKPISKPSVESAVQLPALKPISKPADWSGLQGNKPPSDKTPTEDPKPLVSLKRVTKPPVEKPISEPCEEPRPLVSLRPIAKPPAEKPISKPIEEPKPLVSLKHVTKPLVEEPIVKPAGEEAASPFGPRVASGRPAGGIRQSQLVQQNTSATSEVIEEVSGVWGRVSAIRDTFDAGSRSAGMIDKCRAPTMAVPNAFHQMPCTDANPRAAPATAHFERNEELEMQPFEHERHLTNEHLVAWGDGDEQECMEPGDWNADQLGQSEGVNQDRFSESLCHSGISSDNCYQSYEATESVYQSNAALSSQFRQSATDGAASWTDRPISGLCGGEQPMSSSDGVDDVMFQCEVAVVETTVNQEALQDCLGKVTQEWLPVTETNTRPASAPPVPEVTMRQELRASHDQPDTVQAASLAERQRNRQSWANYNTAPRGWGNQDNFYRPVTFTQPLLSQ